MLKLIPKSHLGLIIYMISVDNLLLFIFIIQKTASPSKSTSNETAGRKFTSSEAAGGKSTGKTTLSHRTNPPKPATRTKQTAQDNSTTVKKVNYTTSAPLNL